MESQKQLLAALRDVVRRALWTLAALPDPDRRFLGMKAAWLIPVVRAANEAYGYSAPRAREFRPSPQDIFRMWIVMDWLSWLRRLDEYQMRRLFAWGYGTPLWKLAQREECSEKTLLRRVDASLAAIIEHFGGEKIEVAMKTEPLERSPASFTEKPTERREHNDMPNEKAYVYGIGFVKGGKRLSDGRYKIKRFA